MAIIRWNPFETMERLLEEEMPLWRVNGDLAVDMFEDDINLIVEMNIAGFDPDKIDISFEDTYLRISGQRKEEEEVKEKNYFRKEIRRGSFERVVHLPFEVDIDKTVAESKNGILRITLPKKVPAKKGKVKIAVKK